MDCLTPMARDNDQDDDELEVSSPDMRFVEREGDSQDLWEVLEIVAEKENQYRVRWAGFNPETNEPWPLDWVPKEDCTDPLVLAWKRKKAEKRKLGRKSIQSRASTTSKVSTKSSTTVTHSTGTRSKRSKPAAAGTKRKHDERFQSPDTSTSRTVTPDLVSSGRPKKKRKVAVDLLSNSSGASTSKITLDYSKARASRKEEEEESSGDERMIVSSPEQPKPQPQPKPQRHPLKTSALVYASDSDEEPPRPRKRLKDNKPARSKSTASASQKAVQTAPKPPLPVSKTSSRTGSTNTDHDVDKAPFRRRLNRARSGETKKPTPVITDSSDESPPPKPQPKVQLKQQPKPQEVAPTRPLSDSTRAPSTSSRGVKRAPSASPSPSSSLSPSPHPAPSSPAHFSPRSPSPRFPSPPVSFDATNEEPQPNSATYTARDTRRDDDEDSALEYADLPITEPQPPSTPPPPPAQPRSKPSLFLQSASSSPTPSPPPAPSSPPSRPKSRIRETEKQFVPETEAEESQERNQNLLHPSPSKNSFVSRMKPRTPGSKRNILDADLIISPLPFSTDGDGTPRLHPTKKPLQPIPQISPSKFLTLPSSTIESIETGGGEDSSIEQFDSPDKSSLVKKKKLVGASQEVPDSTIESGGGNGSLPLPLAATDVMNKGVAMADAVKKAKLNGVLTQAKMPLEEIVEKERKREKSSGVDERSDNEEEDESEREGRVVETTLEAFADSFVDYEGGLIDSGPKQDESQEEEEHTKTEETSKNVVNEEQAKVYLRQEEEESTQDLLMELQQQQRVVPDANEGWAHPVVPVLEDEQQLQVQQSGDEEMVEVVNSLEVQPKSSGPTTETPQEPSSQSQPQPQLPSQPSSTKQVSAHSMDHSLEIPPTLSPTRPVPLPLFSSSSQSQDGPQLESAMSLLNKKSEEISGLENLLTAAQTTIQSLEVENVTLKADSIAQSNEISTLTASLKSLQDKLEYAEKNAEVFRTQYYDASRFVSEVRAENRELQERAEVAESQATTGINGIRTMFEERVKQLEADVAYHRQVTTFMMEQSRRTGDEEIRRRAAEYPEMKMKYEEMVEKLEGASGVIDTFERLITMREREIGELGKEKRETQERMERQMDELRVEMEVLRRNGSLNGGANSVATPLVNGDAITTTPPLSSPVVPKMENISGEIPVYRCLWRKDGKDSCDALFLTREDLQRHIETGGHL